MSEVASPFIQTLYAQLATEARELNELKEAHDLAAQSLLVHVVRRNAVLEYVAQYAPEQYAAWRAENPEPEAIESFRPYLARYERRRKKAKR